MIQPVAFAEESTINITIIGSDFLNADSAPMCCIDGSNCSQSLMFNNTVAVCGFNGFTMGTYEISLRFDLFLPPGKDFVAYSKEARIETITQALFIEEQTNLTIMGQRLIQISSMVFTFLDRNGAMDLKPQVNRSSTDFFLILPTFNESQEMKGRLSLNNKYSYLPGELTLRIYDRRPEVLARFSDSGAMIRLSFSKLIRITGYTTMPAEIPCNIIFDESAVANEKLGNMSSISCVFPSGNVMNVVLDSSSTIVPQDELVLNPVIFSAYSIFEDREWADNSVLILNALSPPIPVAIISAPDNLGSCESVNVSGVASYNDGGRRLTYMWSISPSNTHISNIIETANRNSESKLVLGSDDIVAGNSYTISLIVTNFLGINSSEMRHIITKSTLPIPTVQITGSKMLLYRTEELRVGCTVSFSSCASKEAMVFAWGFVGSTVPGETALSSTSKPAISILGDSLSPNTTYRLQVSVNPAGSPNIVSTAAINISVLPSPISIQIQGGDRAIGSLSDVRITAFYSDPDASFFASPSFAWSCNMTIVSTGEVDYCLADNNGQIGTFDLSSRTSIEGNKVSLVLPKQFLLSSYKGSNVLYTFQVTAYPAGDRDQLSQSVDVDIVNGLIPVPVLEVVTKSPGKDKYLSTEKLIIKANLQNGSFNPNLELGYSWSAIPGVDDDGTSFAIISLNGSNVANGDSETSIVTQGSLVINSGVLNPGSHYKFQVNVTQDGMSGLGYVVIRVASIPTSGTLLVTPSQGEALTTEFEISARNWAIDPSDAPLSFSFEVLDPAKPSLPIISTSLSTTSSRKGVLFPLPQAGSGKELIVRCVVSSSLGAQSTVSTTVKIFQPSVIDNAALGNQFDSLSSNAVMLGDSDALLGNAASFHSTIGSVSSSGKRKVRQSTDSKALVNKIALVAFEKGIPLADVTPQSVEKNLCLISLLTDNPAMVEDNTAVTASSLAADLLDKLSAKQEPKNPKFSISENTVQCLLDTYGNTLETVSMQNSTNSSVLSIGQIFDQTYSRAAVLYMKSLACGEKGKVVTTSQFTAQMEKTALDGQTFVKADGTKIMFPKLGDSVKGSLDTPVNCFCVQNLLSPSFLYQNFSSQENT
jgi:hypothetical protein